MKKKLAILSFTIFLGSISITAQDIKCLSLGTYINTYCFSLRQGVCTSRDIYLNYLDENTNEFSDIYSIQPSVVNILTEKLKLFDFSRLLVEICYNKERTGTDNVYVSNVRVMSPEGVCPDSGRSGNDEIREILSGAVSPCRVEHIYGSTKGTFFIFLLFFEKTDRISNTSDD